MGETVKKCGGAGQTAAKRKTGRMARQKLQISRATDAIATDDWMGRRWNILATIIIILLEQEHTYGRTERRGKVANDSKYNNPLWSCKPSDKNLQPRCYSNNKMATMR